MDNLHVFILAVIQGLTEFLPISSSAHLVLLPRMLGWPDQGLVFDVAVHFGSLLAVLYYFRLEVQRMLRAWLRNIGGGKADQDSLLAWWVIIATLPAIIFGFLLQGVIEDSLRSPWIIATASIAFGVLLWLADLLFLGLTRKAAARFSFLLAMPVIFASGVLQTVRMFTEVSPIGWGELSLGILLSALSAGLCIHYFLRLVERTGMLPFVIYRVLLGLAILLVLY